MSREKVSYNLEQLGGAITSLAAGGDVREKLRDALNYRLQHVRPEGLPEDKRDDFVALRDRLRDSLDSWTAEECAAVAVELVYLYGATSELYGALTGHPDVA